MRAASLAVVRRRLSVAFVLLAACGKPSAERAERPPAPSASASSPSVTPAGSASAIPAPLPPSFEVEIGGKLTGPVAAVRYVFLVAPEPCTVENLGTVKTIAIGEGRRKSGGLTYWTEGNVREGSKGYACAAALDARGRAVGFGVYARNPLVFSAGGKGELEMSDVDIVLAPLSPARALPAQRF